MAAAQTLESLESLCPSCKKKKQDDQLFDVESIKKTYQKNNQNLYRVKWVGHKGTTDEPEKSLAQTPGGRNAIDVFYGDRPGTYAASQRRKY
eukprot:2965191-Rhodomonas_salina.1